MRDWISRNDERDPQWPGDSRVIERVRMAISRDDERDDPRGSGARESTNVYMWHLGTPRDQRWGRANVKEKVLPEAEKPQNGQRS